MAKAQVDPAELRRFAQDLNRFNAELEGLVSRLHSRLLTLGRSWQDQEHRKFSAEFEQTMKAMSRFLDSSGRHAAFLVKKARHIEEYLQQR
ncbi:MAG: WXG100 family type VII secretion target [Sedimentisphaerales bacterium]|nr:WXG100 family type VII secretion target [Sedimentisphaerales bacterium]